MKLFITLIFLVSLNTNAFDFNTIDWFDTSLGFAMNPRSNIRTANAEVKYAGFFYTNSNPIWDPIPIIFLRFANIFINKDGGGVAFAHFKNFQLRALIIYDGEGYKLKGMQERKNSFFAGGLLKFYYFQIKYLRDIESISEGQNLRVDLFVEQHFDNLMFEPHIGVQYWSKKYVDYYYGVRSNETTAARKLYTPSATINYTIELRFIYSVGTTKYILIPMYKNYGQKIADSPVVSSDEEFRFTFGAVWKIF